MGGDQLVPTPAGEAVADRVGDDELRDAGAIDVADTPGELAAALDRTPSA